MLDLISGMRFKRALDVGSGEGHFSKMLLKFCDSVDGIDISESAITRAKSKYHGYSSIEFFAEDVTTTCIDRKYDLVVCAEILYYLNRSQLTKAISRIYTLLNRNGYLLIGNIKRIRSNKGFFRTNISAYEIIQQIKKHKTFIVIREIDRGGDTLNLLMRKTFQDKN